MDVKFAGTDAPDAVCALLTDVALDLPQVHPDNRPVANAVSSTDYTVSIPLRSPADAAAARSTFQRWLWYASRRAGLRLDNLEDDFSTPARRAEALRKIAPILRASSTELETLLPKVELVRFGSDEMMQRGGEVPAKMSFVIKGSVRMVVSGSNGEYLPVATLHEGDFLGQTALTREPVMGNGYAVGEVTVLHIDRDTLEHLVFRKPDLLQDLSQAIDERREHAREVAAAHDAAADEINEQINDPTMK